MFGSENRDRTVGSRRDVGRPWRRCTAAGEPAYGGGAISFQNHWLFKFRAEDKENFTRMLKEVRGRLDALGDEQGRTGGNRFLLTIASSGSQSYFDHTEMDKLHAHLDFINVMTIRNL